MSLIRTSSKKNFSITPQDLTACLDQKNSMIAILQAEVEDLRFNQEKYQRLQQQVFKAKQKYDNCIRDYQISKLGNQERLDLTAKNSLQLKIQVEHLDKQLQFKTQQLKEAKAQLQQLVEHNNRRQDESGQARIKCQQLRTANQLLKMEEDRCKAQVILAREQLQRQRRQNSNINKSLQSVKDKCYKTQSYIRSLAREQSNLNQNLAKLQDQNNYLDNHISELNTVQALASSQVMNVEKQIQQNKFIIASKQLEVKRVHKECKQTMKNLGLEKDKMKSMNEQAQQKKFSLGRMESQVRQCSEQINYIMAKNNEVTQVNTQLRNDLKVCQRHLQNVLRLNKNIESELGKFKEINVMAIKKLQQPMRDLSNCPTIKMSGKWSNSSRMTATGGFDCNTAN